MHDSIAGHLVRRGIEVARQTRPDADSTQVLKEIQERLGSLVTLVVLSVTALSFLVATVGVEYAIRFVIGNLAIIEHTGPSPESSEGFERDGLLSGADIDEEKTGAPVAVGSARITSSLRSTSRHLRSIGGFRSLFRGFMAYIGYGIALWLFDVIFVHALGFRGGRRHVADLITLLASSPFRCAWTHAIIRANPSIKNRGQSKSEKSGNAVEHHSAGWKRFVPGVWSRHLVLPTIRLNITVAACIVGSATTARWAATRQASSGGNAAMSIVLALLPIAFGLSSLFFMVIPAMIALVRVEASLLPVSDEAVVPFDRTFGGRIDRSPQQSYCSYILRNMTTFGSWKTFNGEVFARVVKVYIKFFFLNIFTFLFFAFVFAVEFYAIFGDKVPMLVALLSAEAKGWV